MPGTLDVRDAAGSRVRFVHPEDESALLRMPIEQPHVLLSLAMPADLRSVRIAGPGLAEAAVWVTQVGDDGIDRGAATRAGARAGDAVEIALAPELGRRVNTLRVFARFAGADRALDVELVPAP
jgi:hypothetical protein